jgi:hypothetical protein
MKKVIGAILVLLGIGGGVVSGIQAIRQTETFSFLGMDIVVTQGNFTPLIISVIILIAGVVLMASSSGD